MVALHRTSDDRGKAQELYLLFAGRHGDAAQGVGSLVATFASQEEARAAFRQARLNLSDVEGWADLSIVSAGGRARRVSWFGADRQRQGKPLTGLLDARSPSPAGGVPGRRGPFALRRQHAAPSSHRTESSAR